MDASLEAYELAGGKFIEVYNLLLYIVLIIVHFSTSLQA